MPGDSNHHLVEVQYRHPDRLKARSLLHTRYGRGDWFEWLADVIPLPPGGMIGAATTALRDVGPFRISKAADLLLYRK